MRLLVKIPNADNNLIRWVTLSPNVSFVKNRLTGSPGKEIEKHWRCSLCMIDLQIVVYSWK